MTGTGTEQDPYIVETFEEFDSVRNISNDTYIEWSNAEVDFNDINPQGYDDSFSMKGNITLTNITFKNLTSKASTVINLGSGSSQRIEFNNCKIINAYQITTQATKHFITCNGGDEIFTNCEISYRQDVGNGTGTARFLRRAGGSQTFTSCAITIKSYGDKKNTFELADGVGVFKFCNINLDVQAKKIGYPLGGFMCWYGGKIDVAEASSDSHGGGTGNIVWDVEITQPITLTSTSLYNFLSIYNSDKATITASGSNMIVGVTTEQLKNTSYLYSLGFPAR